MASGMSHLIFTPHSPLKEIGSEPGGPHNEYVWSGIHGESVIPWWSVGFGTDQRQRTVGCCSVIYYSRNCVLAGFSH